MGNSAKGTDVLVLGVADRGVAFPFFWALYDKRGNSNCKERKRLDSGSNTDDDYQKHISFLSDTEAFSSERCDIGKMFPINLGIHDMCQAKHIQFLLLKKEKQSDNTDKLS